MAQTLILKPLGLVLQTAGLVSPQQVQIALKDREFFPQLRIGEIMIRRGWIGQQTADFFAEQWSKLLQNNPKMRLGQYFKAAGLMDEAQIETILREQSTSGLQFGKSAVIKGIISQATLDFFLEQLAIAESLKDNVHPIVPEVRVHEEKQPNIVENYLMSNQKCDPISLLYLYRRIGQQQAIAATGSTVEAELINSGLAIAENQQLKLSPSGDRYFDESWIEHQLVRLQPYSKIRIRLFGLETKASDPYRVLAEVNAWTGGQPFLSQKIYQILSDRHWFIPREQEASQIAQVVREYLIKDWQHQVAAPHLQQLSWQLLQPPFSFKSLLLSYQQIWHSKSVRFEPTPEQEYLLDIGLLKLEQGKVQVANRIYRDIFNADWIEQAIATTNYSRDLSQPDQHHQCLQLGSKNVNQQNSSGLIKIFTLLVCASGVVWFSWSLFGRYQRMQQFQQANQLLAQKKYTAAIAAYDRLLSTKISQRHLLWINRGYGFLGLERYQDMFQSCSNATLIKPSAALAWNCQGEALYYLEKYPDALKAFQQATAKNSEEATFWLNQARVLSYLERHQEAITASQKAVQAITTSQIASSQKTRKLGIAFNQQGQNLLKTGQYSESLVAFEQSLVNAPDNLSAQQGKGIALYELGKYQQAIAIFQQILQREQLTPEQQAMSWLYQGVSLCQLEQFQTAEKAFEQALDLTTDPQSKIIAEKGCGIR